MPLADPVAGPPPTPRLLSATLWLAGAQLLPGLVLAATLPTLIRELGLPYYGVVVFSSAALAVVGIATNGVVIATTRWLAKAAASGDSTEVSSLLATVALLTVALSIPLSLLVHLFAPVLVAHIQLHSLPQSPAIFYLRVAGWSLSLALMQSLLVGLMTAFRRYRTASAVTALSSACLGLSAVATATLGGGLRGVAIAVLVVRVGSVLVLAVLARRHVTVRSLRLRRLQALEGFVSYAGQMSLVGAVATVDQSADGVILGPGVSARAAALYGAGAGLGSALRLLPHSMLTPISVELSRATAAGDPHELHRLYLALQHRWVRFSTGVSAVAVGSVYFGVLAWLGSGFRDSAIVALLVVVGDAVNLWTGVLTLYVGLVGYAGLEARYGATAAVINIGLTLAVLNGGLLAVIGVTSIAEIAGSLYLLRLARRRLGKALPVRSFLKDVPWLAALAAASLVAAIEWVSAPVRPSGLLGLAVAGLPALAGLGFYQVVVMGPRDAVASYRRLRQTRANAA